MKHYRTLSAYFDYIELPRPEHPMLSVLSASKSGFLPCPKDSSPPITNRKELSIDLLEQFNEQLAHYFESGNLKENGMPSIEHMAEKMSVSQRYLSDTLKKETGKTTTEHLQLYLIDQAKNFLLNPDKTVSEVAYELGFEYPQYFSRLFKKKEGISPTEFRDKYKMN